MAMISMLNGFHNERLMHIQLKVAADMKRTFKLEQNVNINPVISLSSIIFLIYIASHPLIHIIYCFLER